MSDSKEFGGGVDQLGAVEDSTDAYQAVGRWWARAVLQSQFNNGADDEANLMAKMMATMTSVDHRSEVEDRIAGFAEAVTHLAREAGRDMIYVDYNADRLLMEAAALAGMPANDMTTFPWKSGTSIHDGVATAHMGYRSDPEQIYPPVAE